MKTKLNSNKRHVFVAVKDLIQHRPISILMNLNALVRTKRWKSVHSVLPARIGRSGRHHPPVQSPVSNRNWLTNQNVEPNQFQWDIKRELVFEGMLELVNALAKRSNTCHAMTFHFVVFIRIGLFGIHADFRMVWAVNEMKNLELIQETAPCFVDQQIRIQILVPTLTKLTLARCQHVVSINCYKLQFYDMK